MVDSGPVEVTFEVVMLKSCLIGVVCLVLAIAAATLWSETPSAEEPVTKVFINGKLYKVTFNDGDSFRVVSGSKKGTRVRLRGFNALESHGPVHWWGTWHPKELYHLAKMATLHARRGVWQCQTEWEVDSYSRPLLDCPDLGEELIRLGYAHALTIDDSPAAPAFVAAQKEAIEAKRGIWAHGVPPFIVTSTHTVEERSGPAYNRTVSTVDGHSAGRSHTDSYKECQKVCHMVYPVQDAKVSEALAALRADPRATALIAGVADGPLLSMVRDYAAYRHINRVIAKDKRDALLTILDEYAASGRFGDLPARESSCMIHVPYQRRYGSSKADCLKK